MTRFPLALLLAFSLFAAAPAFAEEIKPDDTVSFELAAEDWVVAKAAHVTLDVEASVSAANAGGVRADMTKAVNDAAKGDWRITGFNRSQDQSGMERWSVTFDSHLPESALGGLSDAVKKASKPGMQISIASIDFQPTLDETEATRAGLRAHLLKSAGEQLTALNGALPGRSYRIAQVTFDGNEIQAPRPIRPMMRAMAMAAAAAPAPAPPEEQQDHAQKMTLTAHVVYAALPAAATH